jgi:ParB family chromosome partitioning protein
MLGKGLESLIPQKGNVANQQPTGPNTTPSLNASRVIPGIFSPGNAAVVPQTLPAEPVRIDLSAPKDELELPARPAGTEIVAPQEFSAPKPDGPTMPVVPVIHQPIGSSFAVPDAKSKKEEHAPEDYIFHLEVEKIHPNPGQPRREFNEDAIREMANSIREFGILQPIVVSKVEKETPDGVEVEYQLIAGERRLRAAKLLGLRVIPAIIRNVDLEREKLELAVIENLQRENLNAVEMARAFQRLQEEFRMTQREIAAKLGKSRETVANTMRLLDLPEYIQDALQKGGLSESHARLLLAVEDPAAQKQLFDDIAEHGLTTRDVKERVKRFSGGVGHRGRPSLAEMEANLPPEMRAMQDELSSSLGAPVQIQKGAGNGKITITFYSEEELGNILRKLGMQEG